MASARPHRDPLAILQFVGAGDGDRLLAVRRPTGSLTVVDHPPATALFREDDLGVVGEGQVVMTVSMRSMGISCQHGRRNTRGTTVV
jgi:hypothetical protein